MELRNRSALYLLFAANTISGASQGISMIAIPWYFTHVMGKGSTLGLVYGLINVGSFFWGLYAGALVDRYDRKRIFIISSMVGGAIVLLSAAVGYAYGTVPLHWAGLVFATTVFIYNIHYPNLYAFAQEITLPENYGRITSWLEIQGQMTNAFAGGVAALLLSGLDLDLSRLIGAGRSLHIEAWSLQRIFLLDGCTYVIALTLLLFMHFERVAERRFDSGPVWRRLSLGIAWLRMHPAVFVFGSASYALFMTILIMGFFLLAVYVDQHLQGSGSIYAAADMLFALGSVLAGLAVNRLFRNTTTVAAVICLGFIATIVYFVAAVNTVLGIFFFTYMLLGLANAGTRIMRVTWLFRRVPNGVIGRVNSVFNSLNVIGRVLFIGLFSLPFFMKEGRVAWAMGIMAVLVLLAMAVLAINYRKLITEPTLAEREARVSEASVSP